MNEVNEYFTMLILLCTVFYRFYQFTGVRIEVENKQNASSKKFKKRTDDLVQFVHVSPTTRI